MNPYTTRYKTFSYPDLLWIVERPGEYEPEAVEAAQQEIDRREIPGATSNPQTVYISIKNS